MWKTIDGYETYEVSDCGDVRNRKTGKTLGRRLDKDGYRSVYLYSEGKGHNQKVHRLVAGAFLEERDGKNQINHRNGIKEDNRVDNLEWCTRSENTRHAYDTGLLHADIWTAIKAHTKIAKSEVDAILSLRKHGIPVEDIARKYDVSAGTIYRICKGGT